MHWELSDEQDLFTSSLREWLHERAGSSAVRSWLDTGDPAGFERLFVGEGWAGVGFDGGPRRPGRRPARTRAYCPGTGALGGSVGRLAAVGDRRPGAGRRAGADSRCNGVRGGDRVGGPGGPHPGGNIGAELRRSTARTDTVCARCSPGAAIRGARPHGDATSLWLVDGAAGGVGVHPRPLLDRSRDVADITLDDVAARRLDIDATAALGEMPPGQPFWSPPTRWALLNGCCSWPSTTASSANSSAGRSARSRRSNTPLRRCWSPWSPR